jgi:hypothetical protein
VRHGGTFGVTTSLCLRMTSRRDTATARRVRGQGQILEALTEDDAVLAGTLARLGERFGLPPQVVRACILELAHAGWITIQPHRLGNLTIRLNPEPGASRPVLLLPIQ